MKIRDSYKDTGALYDKVKTPAETIRWVKDRLGAIDMDILQETVRIDKDRLGIPV